MPTIGKRIIIQGADFSDIALSSYVRRSIPLMSIAATHALNDGTFDTSYTFRAVTYGNIRAGDIIKCVNPDETFDNQFLVYEVDATGSPEFADGDVPGVEKYIATLKEYSSESYTFDKDCRFLAAAKDVNNDRTRDFTPYAHFGLFNLNRIYEAGKPAPIHAYYGMYSSVYSKFSFGAAGGDIRALAMLDVKAGDVVETASSDFGLLVLKMQDGTAHTYEQTLLADYADTKWTSEANQRVLVVAKSYSHPNSKITDNLNNVFRVTFNS